MKRIREGENESNWRFFISLNVILRVINDKGDVGRKWSCISLMKLIIDVNGDSSIAFVVHQHETYSV